MKHFQPSRLAPAERVIGQSIERGALWLTERLTGPVGRRLRPMLLPGVALILLTLDLVLVIRSVVGNPYWRNSVDFSVYITAAEAIAGGGNPYDWKLYSTVPFNGVQIHHLYPYPPLFAELIAPLLLGGADFARYAWFAISLACIAGSAILLGRHFGYRLPWAWIGIAVGIAGLGQPFRVDLYHGQANFFLLFLIVLGLWLFCRGERLPAGFFWGLAFVIKPFLAILLPWLIWRRAWGAALVSAGTAGGLMLVSMIPLLHNAESVIRGWLATMSYYSGPIRSSDIDNQSFHGLITRLFSPNPYVVAWADSPLISLILHGLLGLGLVVLFIRAIPARGLDQETARLDPPLVLAESGLAIALGLTYGPFTEGDHLFFMVPGLVGVLMLVQQWADVRHWWWTGSAWLAVFLPKLSPAGSLLFRPHNQAQEWEPLSGPLALASGWEAMLMLGAVIMLSGALRYTHTTLASEARERLIPASVSLLRRWTGETAR